MLKCLLFSHRGLISARNHISPALFKSEFKESIQIIIWARKVCTTIVSTCDKWETLLEYSTDPHSEEKGNLLLGTSDPGAYPSDTVASSCLSQRLSAVKEEDTAVNDFIQFPSPKVHSKYIFHLFHDTTVYSPGFVNFPFVKRKGWGKGGGSASPTPLPAPQPSWIQPSTSTFILYT